MLSQLIKIRDLSRYINTKNLFSDFSVSVYSGQRIALIGRNGTGKSSLLKILAREITEYSGKIAFPKNISIKYVPHNVMKTNV